MRAMSVASCAGMLALATLVTAPEAMAAPMAPRLDSWCRDASLVVHARALSVEGEKVHFSILRELSGNCDARELDATVKSSSCIGPPPGQAAPPPFPAGTEVVLFLGPARGADLPVVDGGYAWLRLSDKSRAEILEAVERVVAIERLPSPEERMKAYLGAIEADNRTLRFAALVVMGRELHGKEKAAPWESRLIALVRSPVKDARVAALQALQFSRSEAALPAVLEAVKDDEKSVRECASMALAAYDTEVTVRALLDATAVHPDMVPRVIIDLRTSRRPEAREALVGFLHSENPETRKFAAGSFYNAIFRADPVTLEIHNLVDDPDAEVREAALHALHKSPFPETVGVLAGALRRQEVRPAEVRAAVISLGVISGGVTNCRELRPAFRDVQDLAALMEMALRSDQKGREPPLGHSVVMILGAAGTQEARMLLVRVRNGEFGTGLEKEAQRALEWIASRKW